MEWIGKWWVKLEERIGKLGQAFKTDIEARKKVVFAFMVKISPTGFPCLLKKSTIYYLLPPIIDSIVFVTYGQLLKSTFQLVTHD